MMVFMLVFRWNEIKQESPDQVPLQVPCPAACEPLQSADSITGTSPLASGRNFGLRALLLTGYFFSFWDLFPAKRQSWPCANIPADPAVCQIVRASRLAPATSHHVTFKSLLNRLSPSRFKSLPLNTGGSAPQCFTVHNRVAAATRAGSRLDATDQVAAEHVPVLENIRAVNVEQHGGLKWCKVADGVAGKRDD